MKVGYFYKKGKEFASTGTLLKQYELKDIVDMLPRLPKDHAKHMVGSIWFHTNDRVGVEYNPVSDGIIGCDIDAISKEDCKKIMDSFDTLAVVFPCLVSCWYSHSYYNKTYGGLHLVIDTKKSHLYHNDFCKHPDVSYKTQATLYSAALAYIIFKVCGIDVRPKFVESLKKTAGLDQAMTNIGQQCFLNYSEEVRWNDNVFRYDIKPEAEKDLRKWFTGYNWFSVESDYKTVSCEVKRFEWKQIFSDDFKINENAFYKDNQLGHHRRIAVENFLAGLGWDRDDIVNFMMKICFGNDYRDGEAKLRRGITQTTKTAIRKFRDNPSSYYAERATDILTALGVDIELDVKKVYQPIDFEFDSIFEEVWEEHKDDVVISKVYAEPENVLRLNLNSDEYLMDYHHEIHDMVSKYEMTYLIADCMTGKTTLANDYKSIFSMFDEVDMFLYVRGNTIDVCFPYNSVADNKSKKYRIDLNRVKTKDIENYSFDLTNNFIWNTLMPLYDRYFSTGTTPKNFILFFDESQKIVTDEYRWTVVFEMFKVLPAMYKHFVFMTGTPAGEFFFLKQYFKDYCIIKVDKEIDYKRECKFLKYEHFGYRDRVSIIEETLANGRLPLIYTNVKRYEWIDACHEISKQRVEAGLKPLRILEYSRANSERLEESQETNSIKKYDIVIATKYCSVGIDFKKDDKRMRTAIIDYASERDCTFHDIWQFTLRNRDQDTITKIIVNDDDMFNNRLYNFWYYKDLFDDMAKVHTHKKVEFEAETELDRLNMAFVQEIFQLRKFGNIVNTKSAEKQYFKDMNNVKLLSIYYLYRKIFSNINVIKRMLIERGVDITEIEMLHTAEKNESTTKKEIYSFFVEHFKEVGEIYHTRGEYEEISKQIDVNSDEKEHINGRIIYSRNKAYADWFIKNFAGKDEWYDILKEIEFMSASTFAEFNRMRMIAKRINKTIIKKLKAFSDNFDEEKFEKWVLERVEHDYEGVKDITNDQFRKDILFKDVIEDYMKIYRFSVDNIEFIEEIKNATDEGLQISACHKMNIVIKQKQKEASRKKMSDAGKKHARKIIVRDLRDGQEYEFDSMLEAGEHFGASKSAFSKFVKFGSGTLKKMALVIAS